MNENQVIQRHQHHLRLNTIEKEGVEVHIPSEEMLIESIRFDRLQEQSSEGLIVLAVAISH
jgi:hypothetical protein